MSWERMTDERFKEVGAWVRDTLGGTRSTGSALALGELLQDLERARFTEDALRKTVQAAAELQLVLVKRCDQIRSGTLEEAARLAETHFPRPDAWPECSDAGDDIAKAIRALKDEPK